MNTAWNVSTISYLMLAYIQYMMNLNIYQTTWEIYVKFGCQPFDMSCRDCLNMLFIKISLSSNCYYTELDFF